MPKNKLFTLLNYYFLKNYSFYFFKYFIFQNAFKLHLETLLSILFSAQSTNSQNTPNRQFQLLF